MHWPDEHLCPKKDYIMRVATSYPLPIQKRGYNSLAFVLKGGLNEADLIPRRRKPCNMEIPFAI